MTTRRRADREVVPRPRDCRTSSRDYDAATDIWTRALPALTLLFLVELVALAPNREFPLWLSLLAVVVIFALAHRRLGRS